MASPCSPRDFKRLFEQGDLGALEQLDCSTLTTRLVVRTPADFAEKKATRLNSKQVCFVTPATSWVEWAAGMGTGDDEMAASGLDFVGWEKEDIELAASKGRHARIYVWDGGAGVGSCAATWDLVFDEVLPRCARGAATFVLAPGQARPAAWWDDEPGENQRFVSLAQRLRRDIEAVAWQKDESVGVPEVLAAEEEDQPLKARQALRNILYLEPLFTGDGFTRNFAREVKAPELLVDTKALAELEGLEVIDLGPV